ncbi:mucin-2-like [Homarus americanus]|uniref:mucin-2-like n=1 Tax=Homarus americanus TaxID=6706 RepID=UPI001C47A4DD|nr:mucin-2-like [Homarus americanus]
MMRLCASTPPFLLYPHHSLQRPLRRLPHLLFLLFLYFLTSCSNGVTAQPKDDRTYPLLGSIPVTTFSCAGHAAGYYADPETGCQVYHMCDTREKQYSYLCPNHTLFNQKFMVCDHWYMVNCSSSQEFYDLNHHIGEVGGGSGTGANSIHPDGGGEDSETRETTKDPPKTSFTYKFPSLLPASPKPLLVPFTQRPVTTARPFTRIPFTTAKPFTQRPITTARPFTRIPFTTARPFTQRPITTARPFTQRPITTERSFTTEKPFTTERSFTQRSFTQRSFTQRPVTTVIPFTERPITTVIPFTRRPITTIIPFTQRPITTGRPFTQRPITTEKPFTQRPITTERPFSQRPITTKRPFSQRPITTERPFSQGPITTERPFSQRPITTERPFSQRPITTERPFSQRPITTERPFSQRPITTERPFSQRPITTERPFTLGVTPRGLLIPVTTPSRFFSLPNTVPHTSPKPSLLRPVNTRRTINPDPGIGVRLTATQTSLNASSNTVNATDTRSPLQGKPDLKFDIPFVQTPRPGLPFTMMPSSVARRPGNTFVFTSNSDEKTDINPIDFQSIIFRPVVMRPPSKTRTILTSSPSADVLKLHHPPATQTDQATQHSTHTAFAMPLAPNTSPSQGSSSDSSFPTTPQKIRIPSIFLQPPLFQSTSFNLAPFLPPPSQSTSIIRHVKQEFPTILSTPVRNTNSRIHVSDQVIPGMMHLQFSSSRGNRDFFIPTVGLSLPAQDLSEVDQNTLGEDSDNPDTDDHHHHGDDGSHMTMVFPAPLEERMEELQLNPECPRCHPVFLRPGECHPCVLIK